MVPPKLRITLIFFKSTLFSCPASVTFKTASTANGANVLLCCDTTFEFNDVDADLIKISRSVNSIGRDIPVRISTAFAEQRWNASDIAVG